MIVETKLDVLFTQIDKMGIVHNSVYPIWFEAGRGRYLKKVGLSDSSLMTYGFCLPLIQMECRYKNPARLGDKLVVKTEIAEMSCVKVKFEYRIMDRKSDRLFALGNTVHVWTGRSLKPLNIEKEAPELFRRLKGFMESKNDADRQE